MAVVLEAKERTDRRHSTTRRIRLQGDIPGILYGKNVENKMIFVNGSDFQKTIREAGRHSLITLKLNDEDYSVLLRDIQRDPLRGNIIHVDFQAVDMSTEVDIDVDIRFIGEAAGEKAGGVLQQNLHQLSIRVLPANIPPSIDIDISNLQIGDTITVADIKTDGKYKINHEPSEVIATILPPQQEEEISGEQQEPSSPVAEGETTSDA